MFTWALPTAVRPTYQNVFAKSPGNGWSKSEKHGKYFSEKNPFFKTILSAHRKSKNNRIGSKASKESSLRCFSGHVLCSLENAAEEICPFPIVFVSKSAKKNFFQKKKHCYQNVHLGSSNGSSANLPKCFCQKSRNWLIQIRKTWKIIFRKKSFFQNHPQRS